MARIEDLHPTRGFPRVLVSPVPLINISRGIQFAPWQLMRIPYTCTFSMPLHGVRRKGKGPQRLAEAQSYLEVEGVYTTIEYIQKIKSQNV
jgi:hypothetical protein